MRRTRLVLLAVLSLLATNTQAAFYSDNKFSGINVLGYGNYTAILHGDYDNKYIVIDESPNSNVADFIQKANEALFLLFVGNGEFSATDIDLYGINGTTPYRDLFLTFGQDYWYRHWHLAYVSNQVGIDENDLIYFNKRATLTEYTMASGLVWGEQNNIYQVQWIKEEQTLPISEVPLPASIFLFAPAILGFIAFRRRKFG